MEKIFSVKGPHGFRIPRNRRNGRVVWFRDRATAVRDEASKSVILQGAMFDITETKVAASALLESEYRYYTLVKILR